MRAIIRVKIQTYQITYMNRVLYMVSGNRALVGDIGSVRGNTARQCVHEWEIQECRDGQEQEARLILNRKQSQDLITSELESRTEVLGISEVLWE